MTVVFIDPKRIRGRRDPKIFGQFIEHFHRQIYGGLYDPDSRLSDETGLRQDALEALTDIQPAIIRWPGGCFVSAYHWEDGVGPVRQPHFDKAWRVEDSNRFGTDEYIALCRKLNAEPYICTNAGTGSPEEMSNWVEYCNLRKEGKWAKRRIANGHPEPYGVKYWSIGNENYGLWEIGAKSAPEWGRFVLESAKMMKRVDPGIDLLAASLTDVEWNIHLLKEAGKFLNWLSVHGYWDPIWFDNKLASYETCMAYTLAIEEPIQKTKGILAAMGFLGSIRIAFDEWNLRGWYHPHVHQYENVPAEQCEKLRDLNEINASYTMADAVFAACFLNVCLKNSDIVGMANFAPMVNTRGPIQTQRDGIVLRPTYFVFKLFTHYLGELIVDSWLPDETTFDVGVGDQVRRVPALDIVATKGDGLNDLRVSVVNRHPDQAITLDLKINGSEEYRIGKMYGISGESKDAYNDVNLNQVRIAETAIKVNEKGGLVVEVPPHSVNVLVLSGR